MNIDLDLLDTLNEFELRDQILWIMWHGPRRGMQTGEVADELLRPDSSVRDRLQHMRDAGLVTSSDDAVPVHRLTDEGRRLARQLKRKARTHEHDGPG